MIQYRPTTSLLLILMTALGNVVPCGCQSRDSFVCCHACDHQDSSVDCGYRHRHRHESKPGSDDAEQRRENGSGLVHDHDSTPVAPVKSCGCIRCMTVGLVWMRSTQRLKSTIPFQARTVEVAVLPTTATNAMTFGFRNDVNRVSARERALVRLQV